MNPEIYPWVAGGAAALLLVIVCIVLIRRAFRTRGGDGENYLQALEAIARGDTTGALRRLRDAVEENTDNVGAYLHLGRLLRQKGDHDRALRIHRELAIRKLDPRRRRGVLAEVLEDLVAAGRWIEAKEVAEEILGLAPPDAALLRTKGRIHENLREWDEALDTFETLEKRRADPENRRLALYRAFVALDYEQRGKVKEARKHYETALKLEPTLPGALLRLGEIHRVNGDFDKAIEAWKKLIRHNPNTVSLVFDRLEKVTYEKDPAAVTELAAEYEKILAESPGDASTMRALAGLHRRRGEHDEALRLVTMAIESKPEDARLRFLRARLMLERRSEEAIDEVRTLLARESGNGTPSFRCTECGYRSTEYLWRCPSCERWESFQE